MTQTSFPYDNSPSYESSWNEMAQSWLPTGVIKAELDEYQVYADSSGMHAKVKSGKTWIKGQYGKSDAEVVLPIDPLTRQIPVSTALSCATIGL